MGDVSFTNTLIVGEYSTIVTEEKTSVLYKPIRKVWYSHETKGSPWVCMPQGSLGRQRTLGRALLLLSIWRVPKSRGNVGSM